MSGSAGGVDVSIPLQAGRGIEPFNPLQTIGNFANVQNALNTGELQKQQIEVGKARTPFTINQIGAQTLAPILNKPGLLGINDVLGQVAVSEAGGHPMGGVAAMISKIPLTGNAAADDRALRAFLMANSQAAPESALTAAIGPLAETDLGQERVFGRRDPQKGGMMGGNSLPLSMGPGEASSGVPWTISNAEQARELGGNIGDNVMISRAQQARWLGASGAAGRAGMPAGETAPSARSARPGGSLGPATYQPPSGAARGASTPSAALPPTTNPEDIKAYTQDQESVPQRQRNIQTLGMALKASNLATAGQGAEAINQMRQFLATLTPEWANALGFKPFEVANMKYDLLKKYTTDYARGVSVGGTDMARSMAEASNASTKISPQATREVLKTNLGREAQDMLPYFTAPNTSLYYGKHRAAVASSTDPVALAFPYMSAEDRAAYIKSLGPDNSPAMQKFDRTLEYGVKHGLIQMPGAK